MTIKDINESYSVISFTDETDINETMKRKLEIMDSLSVFIDGYQFMPSYRAGIFDGRKEFYKIHPDGFLIYKGLVESVIKKFGNYLTEEYIPLSTVEPVSYEEVDEHIKSLNLPFTPRDYQRYAFYIALNNPRKIMLSATSSGKSLIIYMLMTYFEKQGKRGILIVPNVGLVEQMQGDFVEYGIPKEDIESRLHIIYAGKEKNFNQLMTCSTWQSLMKMRDKEFETLDYIISDEAHLAKGDSLQHLINISSNCKYKLGFTGTLPSNYVDRFTLTATLGKSETIITAQGLVEAGFATPVEIILNYFNYPKEEKDIVKKMKYPEETKYLEEHYNRNNYIANLGIQLTKKFGNTLIMYNTIKHGEFLLNLVLKNKFGLDDVYVLEKVTPKRLEKIPYEKVSKIFTLSPLTPKDKKTITKVYGTVEVDKWDNLSKYHIFLIRGSVEGVERDKIRGYLEEFTDCILVSNYQTTSTGISIKRLHNMVLAAGTKSNIRLGQSIGRGMRLHEDKDKFRLIDIIDDFSTKTKTGKVWNKNYSLKHSYERLEQYFSYQYPIKEFEVSL